MLGEYIASLGQAVVDFVATHREWAVPIIFALAFGESLAFVGVLLPATVVLFATGALIGMGALDFMPIWLAASIGAALGDIVSYWIGRRYQQRVWQIWPLSRYPDLHQKGEAFFLRWGAASVFLGRFSGPLRASVPLIAGIFEMPARHFQLANWTSAFIWGAGILAPGAFGVSWLRFMG